MREFEVTLRQNTVLRKKRLILIRLEENRMIECKDDITASIELYLKSHTYREHRSNDFQQRLLYTMSVNRLGTSTESR